VLSVKETTLTRLKILIDTTFLLPALGIEVEEEVIEAIRLFRKFQIYYLEVGVLEAMWCILKVVPQEKMNMVDVGLKAIRSTYQLVSPPIEAYIKAVAIFREGHRDYIDALYYASAEALNLMWLTIDYKFIDFLKEHGYKLDGIVITPEDLKYYG